jgi:radical SAM protein with 4Fe4S-binding SPASM domain
MKLNKFFKFAKIFRHYRRGSKNLPYWPSRLWLEPTNRCNLRCTMCPNGIDYDRLVRGDMEGSLFRKIVDEAKDFVDDINLFHRGEPVLHPEIIQMVQYIHRQKVAVRLHTNATLLDEKMARELIEAGLDYVSVSFDGYDKQTYEKIRRGASFEKVLGNVIGLLKIKKEKKIKKPVVVLQLMDFSTAVSEEKEKLRQDFLSHFEKLPLDRFTIRIPHNWAGLWGEENPQKGKYSACLFPFYSLTILYDGVVLPCPQDFYGKLFIGSVKNHALAEIWNGPQLKALRENLHRAVCPHPAPCDTCDVPYRKNFFGLTSGYLRTFLADRFKILK